MTFEEFAASRLPAVLLRGPQRRRDRRTARLPAGDGPLLRLAGARRAAHRDGLAARNRDLIPGEANLMRTEDDLRTALRSLDRATPDTGEVLRRVAGRAGAGTAGRGHRPGRRLLAGSAAAAAVAAVAIAVALLSSPPHGQGRVSPQDALRSVPRYYMALVLDNPKAYEENPFAGNDYAAIRDTATGRTLAIVRPPKPYISFVGVYDAADDRTFVLAAQSPVNSSSRFASNTPHPRRRISARTTTATSPLTARTSSVRCSAPSRWARSCVHAASRRSTAWRSRRPTRRRQPRWNSRSSPRRPAKLFA